MVGSGSVVVVVASVVVVVASVVVVVASVVVVVGWVVVVVEVVVVVDVVVEESPGGRVVVVEGPGLVGVVGPGPIGAVDGGVVVVGAPGVAVPRRRGRPDVSSGPTTGAVVDVVSPVMVVGVRGCDRGDGITRDHRGRRGQDHRIVSGLTRLRREPVCIIDIGDDSDIGVDDVTRAPFVTQGVVAAVIGATDDLHRFALEYLADLDLVRGNRRPDLLR